MPFETHKIVLAILIALLIGVATSIIANYLVKPRYLTKNIYTGPELIASVSTKAPSQEEEKCEPIEPLLLAANVENGKSIAKKCLQCHTLEKGGPHRIGPNLWNSVGAKIAHATDYRYSQAFKEKCGEWTYEALNAFFFNPAQFIPGTKMVFAGIRKAEDRADLIAYLRTLHDSPPPLPQK